MYLEEISGKLQGHNVKIQYDCTGGFEFCGKQKTIKLKYAEKNFKDNQGKHICRKCFLKNNNPMKKQENKDKVKKTCLEKYGTTTAMNTKEQIEKRKELFKDENYKKEWLEKHKKTSLEKYGVEHPMHLESTKNKQKQTMQEKYGVEHPYQSAEIMEKMKKNNLEKYGVEYVTQLPEVKIKMAKTTLEKYGVEHYNQLPEMKDYLRENCKKWLAESWANPWAKGIVKPEEWKQKARETIALRIQNGTWNGGFKSNCRGKFNAKKCRKEKPRFLSSLELKIHYYLDNHPDVEWYDYECFSISYVKKEGTQHLYFPDFLVKFKNSSIEHIIETKTWKEKDSVNVQIKQEAGIKYAEEHNMTYTIMFDEDVANLNLNLNLNLDLESIKKLPQVELI